jgi:hypothetical protein
MTSIEAQGAGRLDIFRWLWRAYARAALVPLLLVEVALVGAYLLTHSYMAQSNVALLRDQARDRLTELVGDQSAVIGEKLESVMSHAQILRRGTEWAFSHPQEPDPADAALYAMSSEGVYHSVADNGGAALFYSATTAIGEAERRKAWQSKALDPLMQQIKSASPLVMQIYLNTHDSMNRIYPYFDVLKQYPAKLSIPEFNFYYEADATHNPARKVVWTEVYLDPAGQGWMASCIAPVYTGDTLEGVVGLDITVESFVKQVLNLQIPWGGYALLLNRDGGIMAMPRVAETELGIDELTNHRYSEAIHSEKLKPDVFNIHRHPALKDLASKIDAQGAGGAMELALKGSHLAAWSEVPQTGWTLLAIVPEQNIYAESDALANRFRNIGFLMITGMSVFYVVFFVALYRRAGAMARELAEPISLITQMADDIAQGKYAQEQPRMRVQELQLAADKMVSMGHVLGQTTESLREARDVAEKASSSRTSFISQMTHELRTPMNAIIGFAQLLELDRDQLEPEHREFVEHIHSSARRLLGLLNRVIEVARTGTVPSASGDLLQEAASGAAMPAKKTPAEGTPATGTPSTTRTAPQPSEPGLEPGTPEYRAQLGKLLGEVKQLLDSNSFSSVSRFRTLQRLLVNHPEAPAIADIGKLIEEMRFRDALEQLQTLPLDSTNGGED